MSPEGCELMNVMRLPRRSGREETSTRPPRFHVFFYVLAYLQLMEARFGKDLLDEPESWERQVTTVVGDAKSPLHVGRSLLLVSSAPAPSPYGVVFEDDGLTGVFYGLDRRRGEGKSGVLDSLLIYRVAHGRDQGLENEVEVLWTPDGQKAALFVNSHCHAFYAFDLKVASGRLDEPPASTRGYTETHGWQPELFRRYWPSRAF
jgi:hypothetical protein